MVNDLTIRESKLCAIIAKMLKELEDNNVPWEGTYIWDSTEAEAKELLASCEYSGVEVNENNSK